MTTRTVYVPRLIESAEQAEALPVGTLAREGANVIIKSFDGRWWWAGLDGVVQPQAEAAVAWTALVTIEAEDEWALIYDGEEPTPCADEANAREWARIDGEGQAPSRRYTTIWEETP